jgi:hypothetical protein
MKYLSNTILLIITLTSIFSCRPGGLEFIPTDTQVIKTSDTLWNDLTAFNNLSTSVLPALSIEKLAVEIAKAPIKATLTNEQGGKITALKNFIIEIPANACTLANGKLATGNVDYEITTLKEKGDIILQNLPSVTSDGKQLTTGGIVIIKAKKGGQELSLAKGKSYKVRFYSKEEPDRTLSLYEGVNTGRFKFDWAQIRPSLGSGATPTLSTLTPTFADSAKGYDIVLDRFKPISLGKNIETGATSVTNFKVKISDSTFTNVNTYVYVVLKDYNSVVNMEGNTKTKLFEFANGFKGLPNNQRVIVVTISMIKEKYYLGTQEATTASTPNTPILVNPRQTTKEQVINYINNL